ncbi:MAG: M20/M25/M40 family metallo-hydrolase [Acidobacteriota bacterium]|nr:MAG: M20/M25/M40 family metallo-hydrolase [Acidobacteriota bacterium]
MRSCGRLGCWRSAGVVAAFLLPVPFVSAQVPYVSQVAGEVSQAEVTSTIQTLQDFGTRYSLTSQCDDAADWIFTTMVDYGLEVSYEEFQFAGKTLRNVVGRLEGSLYPDDVLIVGAHYDSTSESPLTYAPGADDNASGVAGVLEAARILSQYRSESTIEFICFGGEEQGRLGSKHNAAEAAGAGKNILGMVNLDMIGYWPESSDRELDIGKNEASSWLADVAENAALTYASIPVHNWPDTGVCYDDQVSYWEQGYDAIVLMDCYEAHLDPGGSGESTPHYHRTSDTISTLDLAQTTEAVRTTVAAMALLSSTFLDASKLPATASVLLTWDGGVPPYVVEACTVSDCSTGAEELTPPGGTLATEWTHEGVLYDGVDYYYRVRTF